MTPTTLPGYLIVWLKPMSPEDRQRVLREVTDEFCPDCGREQPEGMDGAKRRCECKTDPGMVDTGRSIRFTLGAGDDQQSLTVPILEEEANHEPS